MVVAVLMRLSVVGGGRGWAAHSLMTGMRRRVIGGLSERRKSRQHRREQDAQAQGQYCKCSEAAGRHNGHNITIVPAKNTCPAAMWRDARHGPPY